MASQRSDSELVKKYFYVFAFAPILIKKWYFSKQEKFSCPNQEIVFFETKEDILKRPELQRKNVELVVGVVELVQWRLENS